MLPSIRPSQGRTQKGGTGGAVGSAASSPKKGTAATGTEKYTLQEAELDDDDDEDLSKYQELPLSDDDDDDGSADGAGGADSDIGYGLVGDRAADKREDEELHEYLRTLKFKDQQKNHSITLDAEVVPASKQRKDEKSSAGPAAASAAVSRKPTVVDDFIRNFFVKLQLKKSLEAFQTEWYELKQSGRLNDEDVGVVADIYSRNEQLDATVKQLRADVERTTRVAEQARGTWDKFRKERDFHRMHHRRVIQEKNSLIRDMKRLKKTIFTFQPLLAEAKKKYEIAMKDTMLYKLERDRLLSRVESLESQLRSYQSGDVKGSSAGGVGDRRGLDSAPAGKSAGGSGSGAGDDSKRRMYMSATKSSAASRSVSPKGHSKKFASLTDKPDRAEPSKKISAAKALVTTPLHRGNANSGTDRSDFRTAALLLPLPQMRATGKTAGPDSVLAEEDRPNPFAAVSFPRAAADKYVMRKTFRGHKMAVSALAVHPTKPVVATVSDDRAWKMWSVPNGDLIMSGDGHKDWVSAVDFHPKGHALLATGSGDATVKLWDFMNAKCAATFSDHKHPVWSVAFHDSGDFVLSGSQDGTARLWDVQSQHCRQTYRGHEKAVHSVAWQPFTNILATGSADKTTSLWDGRSGLCVQTFEGAAAICKVVFDLRATTLATADYEGAVTLWDVRNLKARIRFGASKDPNNQHPAHDCVFDNSGEVVAVASYDGSIKVFGTADGAELAVLKGHDEAVQCVRFDRDSSYLISGASDATWRIWS